MTAAAGDGTRLDALTAEAVDALRTAVAAHAPAVFTTSLGIEDMVVLDLIHRADLPVSLVTLDTGRLHEETYALLDRARVHYGRPIRALSPDAAALETFVAAHGVNAFLHFVGVGEAAVSQWAEQRDRGAFGVQPLPYQPCRQPSDQRVRGRAVPT